MRSKTFFAIAMMIPAICMFFSFMSIQFAYAEDARILKIETLQNKTPASLKVEPPELTIEKNSIVIWLNSTQDDEVNIRFDDGKTISEATADGMGFVMEKSGGYSAKYVPFIGTASLRLIKEGTYLYTVTSEHGAVTTTGKIIVR